MRLSQAWLTAVGWFVAACTVMTPLYSVDDLEHGVELTVQDPESVIDRAWVFLPPDADPFVANQPVLASGRVAVLHDVAALPQNAAVGSFDVVLLYRTGPYCGHLPTVSVSVTEDSLRVDILSITRGTCDVMEYDEAVGLRLNDDGRGLEVIATHDERQEE